MARLHLERLPRSVELMRGDEGLVFRYIDERALPDHLKLVDTSDWQEVVLAIKELAVRGAPAIGLAGASALVLWISDKLDKAAVAEANQSREAAAPPEAGPRGQMTSLLEEMGEASASIASARPTAVNLKWAVDLVFNRAQELLVAQSGESAFDAAFITSEVFALVKRMEAEDEAACRAIGAHGAALLPNGARILTHCNAGSLATSFYGTALGVVYAAAEQGKVERVYADETRPVGQGARLTVWELARAGVPVTLICDNMAASLMASGQVDAVVVGADRIARNGDTANKIGTYGVAVLAHEHGVPFYVAAPHSTLDLTLASGASIPIEQREPSEVLAHPIEGVDVWNPAFDITPARFITAIITETGVYAPDNLPSK